jgi:hypothetical protein
MNKQIIRDVVGLKRELAKVNDEIPDAAITLTRTAIQAITTASTVLVWQSQIRGQGMTWSGTNVTVPADGYYLIDLSVQTSINLNDLAITLIRNGLNCAVSSAVGDVDRNRMTATFTRYFLRGDTIAIFLTPSANANVVVNLERGAGESPILHIVQLTNGAQT